MVQVHSGPLSGVIAQLVERQLCKLDVRSSSLLSSSDALPGARPSHPPRRERRLKIWHGKRKSNQAYKSDLKHHENKVDSSCSCGRTRAESLELGIKRRNARGGCLGIRRRRRTGQAPKVPCEAQRAFDHGESEWGNPRASVSTD